MGGIERRRERGRERGGESEGEGEERLFKVSCYC